MNGSHPIRNELSGAPHAVRTDTFRERRYFTVDGAPSVVQGLGALQGRLTLDTSSLPIFLHVGWVPGTSTLFQGVRCLPGGAEITFVDGHLHEKRVVLEPDGDVARMREDVLVEEAHRRFDAAVSRLLGSEPRTPVVPLSGGLDSRAVLGALLRHRSPSEVVTLTFGVPGSQDFEIGNAVARRAGTRHIALDLRSRPVTLQRLLRTADRADANTDIVFPSVWTHIDDAVGHREVTFWTGFTGDGLGGSHAMPSGGDAKSGKRKLLGKPRQLSFYGDSFSVDEDHLAMASDGSKLAKLLSPEEAVWFENHVERYTAHHLFMRGFSYANPFMDLPLARLLLSMPYRLREGKKLFDRWVLNDFRSLFEGIPTVDYGYVDFASTTSVVAAAAARSDWRLRDLVGRGLARLLPRRRVHPKVTYWNLGTDLLAHGRLDDLARELLGALGRRGCVDGARVQALHDEHRTGRRARTLNLTLLMSLEVILRRFVD